jgi:hypothetical protein
MDTIKNKRFWWENVKERDKVEDLDVDGRKSVGIWTEFKNLSDQVHEYVVGCFESGNGEFLFLKTLRIP